MSGSTHDHYVTCSCAAHFSNTIEKCPACGKANSEFAPTLNAKEPGEAATRETSDEQDPTAPTLNGKDA